MALIRCKECGREISDQSKQCIHCGCPIEKEEEKVIPKRKNKKVLIIAIPLLLSVLFFGMVIICGETEVEKQLKMVEKIFSLNYKEIMEEYPNAEDTYDLCIEEDFAGLSGIYNVCVRDDGTVWRVIFEPENESLADESIVDTIVKSLGDYLEYDSEWDYYLWETDDLEIAFWIDERTYFDWIGEE